MAILILTSCLFFAACDAMPSAKLKYRNFFGEIEELDFKLANVPTDTDDHTSFEYDGSLHAVYDRLEKKNKNISIKIQNEWIIIESIADDIKHTAVVFGSEERHTYVLSSMSVPLYASDEEPVKIFFPLYTLPSSIQTSFLDNGIGLSAGILYDCAATRDELSDFYSDHGFMVKRVGSNSLRVINVRNYPTPYMGCAAEWVISVDSDGVRFTSVNTQYVSL